MTRATPAFYVCRTDIGSDHLARVPATAALPSIHVGNILIRVGDRVFVVDEDDKVSTAVVMEQSVAHTVVRVNHEWFPMSLADVEVRAIASAVAAIASEMLQSRHSDDRGAVT
jgi:hypothetical protein